jgi:hypothetical protein
MTAPKITFTIDTGKFRWNDLSFNDLAYFLDNMKRVIYTADLSAARYLARQGIEVVSDTRHEPVGTLEHIGYTDCVDHKDIANYQESELSDYLGVTVVTPVMPVYRGPVKYLVFAAAGDEDGVDYEPVFKDTEEEAKAFIEKDEE